MNRRQKRLVSIVVVVLAVFFLYSQFRSQQRAAEDAKLEAQRKAEEEKARLAAQLEKVKYVVPREKIPKRTVITDAMIQVVEIEKKYAPWKDKKGRERYPENKADVVNKIALTELAVKEPIHYGRLAAKDDLRAISFVIEPGKRAITIPMDPVRGVGGFIRQGDYVDIVGSFQTPGGAETLTKTLFQRVRVLIVDRTYVREGGPAPETEEEKAQAAAAAGNPNQALANLAMVTFEVTPKDAEALVLAASRIPLHLVLRNPGDSQEVSDEDGTVGDVDIFRNPAAPPPEPKGRVEVILGSEKISREVGVN